MINYMAFVDNLYYLGIGMLGIFVAIGIIVAVTLLLNLKISKNK